MKKVVKKIVLLFLILLLVELIVYLFKSNHTIEYKIKTNDEEFTIKEIYQKNNYYFNINIDNNNFSFNYENKFHKTRRVIQKVKYYQTDEMSCLFPILKDNNYLNIICLKDDNLYYYDYIKEDITEFTNQLKKKGYAISSDVSVAKKLGNSKVYVDNIDAYSSIYVWKYNGFYALTKNNIEQLNLFDKDTYLNKLGIQVNNYYIIPDYDENYEYNKFYILNMKNNQIKTLKFKDSIADDYYNNGVVDNKLYLFDKENLLQYKINPKRNRYEIVGSKDDGGLYYNNKDWETLNIYDFKKEELTFKMKQEVPKELQNYDVIFKDNTNYYYFDGNDYIVYNTVLKNKIYLFNLDGVSNQKFIDNDLYFIKENTLYYYNIYHGLKKIMEYEELSFNKVNRYAIYKK